jgi:hypothetical protein
LKPLTALISTLVPAALAATSISLSLTLLNGGGGALQALPLVPAVDGPASRVAAVLEAPTGVLSPKLRKAAPAGTEATPSRASEASAPKPERVAVQPPPPAPTPTPPTPPTPPTQTSPPPPSPPAAELAVDAPPPRSHVHGKAKAFGLNKPKKASANEQSASTPHGKAKGHRPDEPKVREPKVHEPKVHEPKVHEPGAPMPKGRQADKEPKGSQAPEPAAASQDPKPKQDKDKGRGDGDGSGGGKK